MFLDFRLGRRRRSVSMDLDEKVSILQNLETYLPAFISLPAGSKSHECILRAICEVARTPLNDDGLLGDFINILLTPLQDELVTTFNTTLDYIQAQHRGKTSRNCQNYHNYCDFSFFEVTKLNLIFEIQIFENSIFSAFG